MTMDLSQAARTAEQAAYAAGTHLLAARSRLAEVVVTQQAPDEVVAEIDREALALIRDVVRKRFPEHGILGADPAARAHDGRPLWVVEPISGSADYLRGTPHYAVSLALVQEGEPQVGVVYDPSRNEFFGAVRGRGAVLNGTPIRCSSPHAARQALAATVFPRPSSPRLAGYMAELGRVLRDFGSVRRSACTPLEMAHLAAARIDAFWGHDLRAWAAAAGVLLLHESGARVEARDGEPLLLSRSLLACTPAVRDSFVSLLTPH
ncbi:MAG TPA: inositol monophosphatase [Albitalea sp.]|nr:inositol monophosphatase [Albitalea sp.]